MDIVGAVGIYYLLGMLIVVCAFLYTCIRYIK